MNQNPLIRLFFLGIECVNGKLFISQLYEVLSLDTDLMKSNGVVDMNSNGILRSHDEYDANGQSNGSILPNGTHHNNGVYDTSTYPPYLEPTVFWEGHYADTGDYCYLTYNLSKYSNNVLCMAIYRKMSTLAVQTLKHQFENGVSGILNWFVRAIVCSTERDLNSNEFAKEIANDDVFEDCYFVLYDAQDGTEWHFKLSKTILMSKLPENMFFDGHLSNIQHYAGKLICMNYKSNLILIMDDNR
jgi:hypothetical protein